MAITSTAIQVIGRVVETTSSGPTTSEHVHSVVTAVDSDVTGLTKAYSGTVTSPGTLTVNALTDACGDALDLTGLKVKLLIVKADSDNSAAVSISGMITGTLAPGDWVAAYGNQHASLSTALAGTETLTFTGAGDVEVLLLG
jgi:hypothetical protein